ncbi:MAG: phosphoribosylaminoimidazolesuccinocarboxamide synthase [Bacteroidota bacterium]
MKQIIRRGTNVQGAVSTTEDMVTPSGKKGLFIEGRAKRFYHTGIPDLLIQEFMDDSPSLNGKRRVKIKDKGALNNEVSSLIFEYLNGYHVHSHFVKKLSANEMLVRRLEIMPLEVVVRNVAAGRLCRSHGIKEGQELPHPIIEHYLKNSRLGYPLLNEFHISALELATPEELKSINRTASKINAVLKSFFDRRKLKLVDFKLEFGRYNGQILVGGEISLDTCRFRDRDSNQIIGVKNRTGAGLEDLREGYLELRERLCEKS